ncbi:MarR family winged helix-turn-helix transcriptional regulator [Pseudonocardia sediminis]|uniref:MarR family winged helix-turn-helix transcriptional regulator n=1 Tax=Pseudonocardia sediminis TaxID=1397368 RepID=UPI001F5FD149|nr:MarR family winged helix-turn-helix transcriptional regulator [Pseudonocardia sediminis]
MRAFQELIDELHVRLADDGFPDVRPTHGFVLQAVGPHGTTAVELGRALGVSKQAAGKTVAGLEAQGYLERGTDPSDTRRKLVRMTPRGHAVLTRSAAVLDELRARWADELGEQRVRDLEDALAAMTSGPSLRLDTPAWFGRG